MGPRSGRAGPHLLRTVSALLLAHQPAASFAAPLGRPAPAAAHQAWCARARAAGAPAPAAAAATAAATALAFAAPVEHGAWLHARRAPATAARPAAGPLLAAPGAARARAALFARPACAMQAGAGWLGLAGGAHAGRGQPHGAPRGAGAGGTGGWPRVLPTPEPVAVPRRSGRGGASPTALHLSSPGRRSFSDRGGRGGRRGRGGWRSELSPSERRVLQKQRRDGSISEDDRAKLSRAERMERVEQDRPAGRGSTRGVSPGPRAQPERVERDRPAGRGGTRGVSPGPRAQPQSGPGRGGDGAGAPREAKPVPEWVAEKMGGRRGGAGQAPGAELSPRRQRRIEWNARRLENDQSGAWRDGQGMQRRGGLEPGERGWGQDDDASDSYYGWDRERPAPPSARGRAPYARAGSSRGSVWGRDRGEEGRDTRTRAAQDADDDDGWEPETVTARGTLARLAPVAGFAAVASAEPAPQSKSLRERFFPDAQAQEGAAPPVSAGAPESAAAGAGGGSVDAAGSELETFAGYRWDDKVLEGLQAAGITAPSPIQAAGIPVMISGANAILHSPTGSGKTLSFLLPLVARLRYALVVGLFRRSLSLSEVCSSGRSLS